MMSVSLSVTSAANAGNVSGERDRLAVIVHRISAERGRADIGVSSS